jgi:hypothetical protein
MYILWKLTKIGIKRCIESMRFSFPVSKVNGYLCPMKYGQTKGIERIHNGCQRVVYARVLLIAIPLVHVFGIANVIRLDSRNQ